MRARFRPSRSVRREIAALSGLALLGASLATGCSPTGKAAPAGAQGVAAAVPVSVATAVRRDVPVTVRAIGHVEAMATVTVRSQIDGRIEAAAFVEGAEMREGDVLFRIDARPFEAALQMAEANLAQSQAQSERFVREAARVRKLFEEGQASDREQDQADTMAKSAAAEVEARQAQRTMAQLDLEYCRIRAPMAGRVGNFLVHPGAIVEKNKTDLVLIHQMAPIYVEFALPEQYLPSARNAAAEGHAVAMQVTGDPKVLAGRLTFVDNAVDPATGMIRLKATFGNTDRSLWPGAFGTVDLTIDTIANAVVVPATAVQQGPVRPFVFVVGRDDKVEARDVASPRTMDGQSVIAEGLQGGETVVVEGQLRLTNGSAVSVRRPDAPASQAVTESNGGGAI